MTSGKTKQPDPVVLAGATGDLGMRIAKVLIGRGAQVRALVRAGSSPAAQRSLGELGATLVSADLDDVESVARAADGAAVVVSALSGLREVIVDRQSVLLDAAVRAGVPRFVSSDFCEDYTKTRPGHNRNLDLRREFAGRADRAFIRMTSVFNGAFLEMIGQEMPIVAPKIRRVLYWGSPDALLDFTTRDDTAAYTAAVAMDDTTPRVLRIAGDSLSSRDIARAMSDVSGTRYRTQWAGSVGFLRNVMVPLARRIAPQRPDPVFPAWQGMQYMVDMYSGDAKLTPLDTHRYPELNFTTVAARFAQGYLPGAEKRKSHG